VPGGFLSKKFLFPVNLDKYEDYHSFVGSVDASLLSVQLFAYFPALAYFPAF
jgi:hypothetical protein